MTGAEQISVERTRQMLVEKKTLAHDTQYTHMELTRQPWLIVFMQQMH